MEFRPGTCTSCNHSFRVAASITAAKAKCPKCGGVAELGAAQAAENAASKTTVPAATSAAKELAASREGRGHGLHGRHGPHSTGHSAGHARGERKKPLGSTKPNRLPFILGGVVVVLGIVGLAMSGGDEPAAAPAPPTPAAKPDFSKLPDAERLEDTSDAEWDEMIQLIDGYMKPPFNAAAQRSGDLLMRRRNKAVPAIINGYKRLDITTKEGTDTGWKMQTLLLQGLCEGTNFGWKRDTAASSVAFNQGVVERWLRAWSEAKGDAEKWKAISQKAAAGTY